MADAGHRSNEHETNVVTVNDETASDASTSTQQTATASGTTSGTTSANESGSSSAIDGMESNSNIIESIDILHAQSLIIDSIVVIDDPGSVRPIARDEDEDVIFVTELRQKQPFRTIATIDLCDTPDTSFTQPAKASSPARAAADANNDNMKSPPARPGSTKCPICLDSFGFDEIMSTMCGHLFCEPCIRNTIKTRKKCPMCNRSLKMSQIHRIFLGT